MTQHLHVTFFRDEYANSCTSKELTLEGLRNVILNTGASRKDLLPWLKLARFGDKLNDNNCLRYDENVEKISGVEADYDGKKISVAEAAETLKAAHLKALLYTSPSYSEAEPKWRILTPVSKELPPGERSKMLERLNGLFGGIFSHESFTLSQSYFYGSVARNPEHQVILFDGDYVDQRNDLDAGALGKGQKSKATKAENLKHYGDNPWASYADEQSKPPIDVDDIYANMVWKGDGGGGNMWLSFLSLTSAGLNRYPKRPIDDAAVEAVIDEIIERTEKAVDTRGLDWQVERANMRKMCRDWLHKHPELVNETPAAEVEPVDLWANFEPPALPRKLLPKLIEEYAFTMGEVMGCDPAGIAMSALAVCGAAIPDAIELQMKEHSEVWQESARLWVALVGLPSFKKSPTMSTAAQPLRKLDHDMVNGYLYELKVHKEMPAEERKDKEPPKQNRLCLEDTTIEAAQEVLEGRPNGVLLYVDELSGFFGSMDKYSGARGAAKDRGFWLTSWKGGRYAVNRIGRGVSMIPNLSIALLGGIQPDVIRKIAADSHDDGFLARMLMVMARPAVMSKDAPATEITNKYEKLVKRLTELKPPAPSNPYVAFAQKSVPLCFDDGAQKLRAELEQKHLELAQAYETFNKKLAATIGKFDGYFGRLCVLFHCIEHADDKDLPPTVTIDTARRVAKFMNDFLFEHAAAFYCGVLGLADEHDRLAAVAGYILTHKEIEELTPRDIQRGTWNMHGLKRRDIEGVFEQLEALGWVTRIPGPRQVLHWVVNPKVHERFAERAAKEITQRNAVRQLMADDFARQRRARR